MGLVQQVYDLEGLKLLVSRRVLGHNRYATSGGAGHCQPVIRGSDGEFALVHNGNIPNLDVFEVELSKFGINIEGKNDSEIRYPTWHRLFIKEI